jgi:hypothetical protein
MIFVCCCWTGLDASQLKAVGLALSSQDIALVHGPPGTGMPVLYTEVTQGYKAHCSASLSQQSMYKALVSDVHLCCMVLPMPAGHSIAHSLCADRAIIVLVCTYNPVKAANCFNHLIV